MFVSQYQAMGVNNVGDTTYTKIFVGGLAWETQRETMKRHFEQFGEILEAVVITDKYTGRSKGYGFVTFKDPDSAMRACQDPSPVIDGRRANCNLASLGAQKNRPPAPSRGTERFRPTTWSMVPLSYRGIAFPYSTYGYSGYPQPQDMHTMNYYNGYGGQQVSSYYTGAASGSPGIYYSYYPFYAPQYGQSSSAQLGFGIPSPQTVQYSHLPQQSRGVGAFSFPAASVSPSTSSMITSATVGAATVAVGAAAGAAATASASDQNSSA
ncbi:uncharacterized protein LOC131146051 isoform X2 [Malania oleifera]|uniref:uncharacterized protein LOC131146051 isoform X2 n=1 Tax=Malania oleifera TaxID=397392 RepID=UPI0025AE1043|nr:uncharacterized protein LOC131146051 isoform X2 [Malania oleifera]